MDHVLRTDRLLLQPVTAQDLTALVVHWTQPDVRRFLFDGAVMSDDAVIERHRHAGCGTYRTGG